MALVFEFRFLLISHLLLVSSSYGHASHDKCPTSFNCGKLGSIQFPLTKAERPDCGLMMVHNCDDPNPHSNKTIELDKSGKQSLQLKSVFPQLHLIEVFNPDLHTRLQSNGSCEVFNNNISISENSPLISFYTKYNITLFKCPHHLNVSQQAGFIKHNCSGFDTYHYGGDPNLLKPAHQSYFSACSSFVLPKKDLPDTSDLQSFLSAQMVLVVRLSDDCDKCYNHHGGQCKLDNNNKFYCDKAPPDPRKYWKLALGLGIVSIAAILGVYALVIYGFRRTLILDKITIFWKNKSEAHQRFEAFLKSHGSLATKRYSYSDIKKMTNCFKEKLGQGGYGSVFKGKLHDKCLVAVKVLKETKGNGEEFINEVASISKTCHVNIVTLLGFCFEGSKKALVYEFMANGSLEKFIFKKEVDLLEGNLQLSCEILHQITVGVARGLEYLHRGCNTRIFHFDIKPHNILLDENFCSKISDFGLAKTCLRNESVVSITGARGTIGYIAPEVISRSFGVVSQKSDVYSFGMMVLEMVGGRRNVNVSVDDTSEIYFPHWIYKRLESNEELALKGIRNEGDKEIIRQMVITSLWCIQTNPSKRPVISKVVEMLEGRAETLQVPPKPYLSSPSTSPCPSSSSNL